MKQTSLALPQYEIKFLKELSEKTGLGISDLVRRAIDNYYNLVPNNKEKDQKK